MRYKNITKNVLRFRANNAKGEKVVVELKPDEEFDSDRIVALGGLEQVGVPSEQPKKKSTKKIKEGE